MDKSGYRHIPHALFEFITFLVQPLPIRSVPTFIELLVGAMLTQAGFVTQAWLAIKPLRHWTSYYKWLQKGKWSWTALGAQTARFVVTFFPQALWFLILDDTLIFRSSKKAPGSGIQHQHGSKTNRPQYVLGQCWVTLALSVTGCLKSAAVPLLSRLMRVRGNSSKLDAAKTLLRVIAPVFAGERAVVLMDSWYMRRTLLEYILNLKFHAIGQVRKDTALYALPVQTGGRGRPKKYGDKFTAEMVAALPETRIYLHIYGKWQWVRYRSAVVLARFMGGREVRAVWIRFEDKKGKLTKERLILATRKELLPFNVVTYYSRRWGIEELFNQMKNSWGWKEAWQQSRQTLHRWTQLLSIGYALPQLLALKGGDETKALSNLTPWREKHPLTAGRVRLGLQKYFSHFPVRTLWGRKSRKFEPPFSPESLPGAQNALKTA